PRLNAVMAGELANANRAHLERTVGGDIGPTELYLAHFLGAEGATEFLTARREDPARPAADLLPAAARANRDVFFDAATGAPRSLAAVHERFERRLNETIALTGAAPRRQIPHAGTIGRDLATPLLQSTAAARLAVPQGHEGLSLWTVLTLNALPPPGAER
ncbi:MAG: hypothetical protein HKM95_16045, partial [Inquilinus sp.]|nr:hypothetical protein [Inquilinus sp.]